ncbi:uncharacterized protein L203_100411 [Cryptococcus depauperatus CBS 7841]|uniref:Uncharacterized protein n=1 Tax=Cryptococcus depauperatus CBS 7841 TaxID=1295531 RepID=A0AAJ8JN48_9TREE
MLTIAATVSFKMCMASAGQQTPNIALRIIQNDLRMPGYNLQWIISVYSLVYGCFLLLSRQLCWWCSRRSTRRYLYSSYQEYLERSSVLPCRHGVCHLNLRSFYRTQRYVNWIGTALTAVGWVFLHFGTSDGERAPAGWKTRYITALLIVGILLKIDFFIWEKYIMEKTIRPPLMRLQLWTRAKGRFAAVYFFGFVSIIGFISLFYHAVLSLQRVQSIHPVGTMLCFLPTSNYGVTCSGSQFRSLTAFDLISVVALSPFQTNNLLRCPL